MILEIKLLTYLTWDIALAFTDFYLVTNLEASKGGPTPSSWSSLSRSSKSYFQHRHDPHLATLPAGKHLDAHPTACCASSKPGKIRRDFFFPQLGDSWKWCITKGLSLEICDWIPTPFVYNHFQLLNMRIQQPHRYHIFPIFPKRGPSLFDRAPPLKTERLAHLART